MYSTNFAIDMPRVMSSKSGCDDVKTVGVMTQIRDCDVTGIVYMLPYILDVVSYIEVVMSKVL